MSATVVTRRSSLLALVALFALGLASGCASGLQSIERTYARGDLAEVPLQKIDVLAYVSGPPRVSGPRLDVKVFPPPALDQPLVVGQMDAATTAALERAIAGRLVDARFEVGMFSPRIGPDEPPPVIELEKRPGAPVETSTTVTSTRALASIRRPTPNDVARIEVRSGETLREVLARSHADAVLVVRAVPVDRFYVDLGKGTHIEITALGKERVEDSRPEPREGRLLLGQAFLFDRKTGLRLWTKQLPDFPENGRLTPGHPFLAYGFVHEPAQGAAPTAAARAEPAAQHFADAMLHDLPKPTAGTAAGRAKLDQIDVAREEDVDAFFDAGRLALDVGVRWTMERVDLDLRLGGQDLAPLGTGALAPNGALGVTPRLTYLFPGGLAFSAALPISTIPSSFARSYHRDNPTPNAGDPDDRSATVRVDGGFSAGLELSIAKARAVSRRLYVLPTAGVFAERLSFDATPGTVLLDTGRTRLGLLGGVDALYRLGAEDGPFFVRAGGRLRGGLDLGGSIGAGFDLSASLGVFL